MHVEGDVKQGKLPNNVQGLTPAQNHEVPSVCRGQMSERAIPALLNGLPICCRANASMRRSAPLLQPRDTYEYSGLRPVRLVTSCERGACLSDERHAELEQKARRGRVFERA